MKEFKLAKEYITIGQFLKVNDYISSGAQAKYFLLNNIVKVNDLIITERGKKIFKGNIVLIRKNEYVITS